MSNDGKIMMKMRRNSFQLLTIKALFPVKKAGINGFYIVLFGSNFSGLEINWTALNGDRKVRSINFWRWSAVNLFKYFYRANNPNNVDDVM